MTLDKMLNILYAHGGAMSKDDVVKYQLTQDFATHAQFYDQIAPYKIGYIGKSIDDAARWGIWKSFADTGTQYVGFFDNKDQALAKWSELTGENSTSAFVQFDTERVQKSVETISENGEWFYVQGQKVQVNDQGVIIKGPDILIGQRYESVAAIPKWPMHEIFRLWNFGNTRYYATNMSNDIEISERGSALEHAKELLTKAIKKVEATPYKYNKD